VSKVDLQLVAEGRLEKANAVSYGTADGMKNRECNGGTNSALRTRDGRLWFSTVKGVAIVDPAALGANPIAPPVRIEQLLVDDRPLDGTTVPPGRDRFEFQFTALSLLAPEKVRFKYRLDGFDHHWIETGKRRTAYYTRLPHGSYAFRVIACNNDGVWNQAGAALPFRVEPHLYETLSFRMLSAGALVLAAGVAIWGRIRQLKAREKRLVVLVAERTRDVLAEKARAEEALSRAEDATRAKTAFLATMSHELRTPLNAILGFAQLMRRRTVRSAEDHEQLGIIARSGEHLLGLINDILSISRIEAGDVRLRIAPFDPSQLLGGLHRMFLPRAEAKGLRLVLEASDGLPAWVAGDEGKLRQVLINLLGNAIKFTERGRVELRAAWREGRATFEVADTGPGIALAEQATVFDPFVQSAGLHAQEGSGLGLAISRRYVRLMGGELLVTSAADEGARFRFEVELPTAPPPMDVPERVVRALSPGQRIPRILVVDDVKENRTLLARLHLSVGIAVCEAACGKEAIARWKEDRPDLIWMDIRMDAMDGLAAVRAIRTAEAAGASRAARVPIIAVTASAFDHEREAILAAGFDDVVAKPFADTTIFAKLDEHLGVRFDYEERGAEAADDPAAAHPRLERGPVLVAEDHPVNQALILAMLQESGCRADLVTSGGAAVEAASGARYRLVLMDCEMPGMDGFAAAREIRRREGAARRTPIVALTARSEEADRERCLAAGMDDYLAKPLKLRELQATLDRWVPRTEAPAPKAVPTAAIESEAIDGLRIVGGSALGDVIDGYLRSTPAEIVTLRRAAAVGDGETLRRGAHGLKGSSNLVGARALAGLCQTLSTTAGDAAAGALDAVRRIEDEFTRVETELLSYRRISS
jgi:signal transduction histidine kinase/CheY-like chemotaxis protein/HPt (histidine-containing phosphotransfer) domain-containing protein